MDLSSKDIQLQYEGFLKTPLLWTGNTIFNLNQFNTHTTKTTQYNSLSTPEIRLGKRVEQFSFFAFEKDSTLKILSENIQIQDKKRTVGEIDCLLLKNKQPIHIEIIYKFYLYNDNVGTSEIEHWIGPNKRDSLFQKLTKLKNKQLPLLQSEYVKPYLNKLHLSPQEIDQNVYFKAQLFVPLNTINNKFSIINNDCIYGFYIHFEKLKQFENCKFYIPSKLNWLIDIQTQTKWISFTQFQSKIIEYVTLKTAPLCWLKYPNGEVSKFFVVWWLS